MDQGLSPLERKRARLVTLLMLLGLALSVLVPYWKLTSMRWTLITDDMFVSDVFSGEFPARSWLGTMLKSHEAPLWMRDAGGGVPIVFVDPLTICLFWALPPAIALNVQLLAILILASVNTYVYARTVRCSHAGAALAGVAFSYSGFMVCQLKHVTAVEIVAWFPLGLALLERGLGAGTCSPRPLPRRALALAWFALVAGLQILPGFPQTTYYCFLAYLAYGLTLVLRGVVKSRRMRIRAVMLMTFCGAMAVLAIGIGAALLLPMYDVAAWSERADTSYEWVSLFRYHWPNLLSFFIPYANGDVSDGTHQGGGLFWEEYGYVGLLTIVLALGTAVAFRRARRVRLLVFVGFFAFLLVLGPSLPGFRFVFEYVPGMKNFRFTTRAMFIVDFALSVLAGIGVTAIEGRMAAASASGTRRAAKFVGAAVVGITFADLAFHQLRQNAYGEAATFLAPPATARFLREHLVDGQRYLSLRSRAVHRFANKEARGWADTRPYVALLPMLEPNTNLYWGVSSAETYTGLPLVYSGFIWGNESHSGLIDALPVQSPGWLRLLRLHSVSHVLSFAEVPSGPLRRLPSLDANVIAYDVPDALPRAYVATRVIAKGDMANPVKALLARDLELGRDVILDKTEAGALANELPAGDGQPPAKVSIVDDRNTQLALDVDAPGGGVLVLTDNYVPIWRATVDGMAAPVLRANFGQRAVPVSAGRHRVAFSIKWPGFELGVLLSSIALIATMLLVLRLRVAVRTKSSR